MKGIILSGGQGTRLRPITHTGPKQLVPVANKPILEYAIEDLRDVGITDIGIVLGNLGRQEIQSFLGDGSQFGVDITYIVQGNPIGLAHAVGCARDFVGKDDFVVYLGDNILKQGISELVLSFRRGDYAAGIALQPVDNPQQFGVADVTESGEVVELVEKPDNPPSDMALIGIYVFSTHVFDAIERISPSWRGELEITDAIQTLLDDGYTINSHIVGGWWKDTGKPKDVLEANRLILENGSETREIKGTVEEGAEVAGHVDLHESATVEQGAVIRGPASIADNAVIGEGTYVGPYTSIGPESTIRGAHIENSVIIGEAEIETKEKIVDSIIGRSAVVGNSDDLQPEGQRLVVGQNSTLML